MDGTSQPEVTSEVENHANFQVGVDVMDGSCLLRHNADISNTLSPPAKSRRYNYVIETTAESANYRDNCINMHVSNVSIDLLDSDSDCQPSDDDLSPGSETDSDRSMSTCAN